MDSFLILWDFFYVKIHKLSISLEVLFFIVLQNLTAHLLSANHGPLCHFLGLMKRTFVFWVKNGQLTVLRISPLPIPAQQLSKNVPARLINCGQSLPLRYAASLKGIEEHERGSLCADTPLQLHFSSRQPLWWETQPPFPFCVTRITQRKESEEYVIQLKLQRKFRKKEKHLSWNVATSQRLTPFFCKKCHSRNDKKVVKVSCFI